MSAVGSVEYLNAAPLVAGLENLVLDVPRALASRFAEGSLAAALSPVFDTLLAGSARAADWIAIGCDGPVSSVFVASELAPSQWKTIARDPDSLSSNALLEVLLREHWKSGARIVGPREPACGRLIIGDPALAFREKNPHARIFDLGEEWKIATGLPFVFAVWRLAEWAPPDLPGILREAKSRGLADRPRIAGGDPAKYDYLTRNIRYDLGPRQKMAIGLFAELALKHGLLKRPSRIDWL